MSGRYECRLSEDLLTKAVTELHEPEDEALRLAAIYRLRTKFEKETKDSFKTRTDDSFILRFLRVRKFNEDAAYATLRNYHFVRTGGWKELFVLVEDPESLKDLAERGSLVPLRNSRANDGTFIIFARPGRGFKERKDMLKFFAVLLLTLEYLLENEEFQICGLTIVVDMSTVFQLALYGKKFLHVIQEAMPVRVKSLNMVNEAIVFDAAYAIISRFLKEKMKTRLRVHGADYTRIHEAIDKAILPPFLNGNGPELNAEWLTAEVLGIAKPESEL